MSEVISLQSLLQLVGDWMRQGKRVFGPVRVKEDLYLYAPLSAPDQLVLEGLIRPANSIKELLFPRHEKVYRYRFKGHDLELADCDPPADPQIIVGGRPCDAAALPILDAVFNWDFKDKFYNSRREATTVVTLACAEWDDQCFCTSVGLGPAAKQGSDVLLLPYGDGVFEVRCLTSKGHALFAGKTESSVEAAPASQGPPVRFDLQALQAFLNGEYENPVWRDIALRCLGCGACAYTCPTCHCFDIADEGDATGGARVKNWDSCQFGTFTLHASGHNPRATQSQRQRQRIQHKFHFYPEKFGAVLCTGCGNCTRNCPVSLGVLSTVEQIRKVPIRDASEVQ